MQIEIRKPIGEYRKRHGRLFLYVILENSTRIVCLFILLLLLVCESYCTTKASPDPHTVYIGGGFSLVGFMLWFAIVFGAYRRRKKYFNLLSPTSEQHLVFNDDGCKRSVPGLWSDEKNWKLLTRHSESEKDFWLYFVDDGFFVLKADFKSPADIEELRKFLKEKTSR